MSGKIVGISPTQWQDVAFWFLRFFWEPSSRKQSHWWHWRNYQGPIEQTIAVTGDSRLDQHNWKHNVFWGTNFTWQQVVVLRAQTTMVYHVGFRNSDICQLCSLMLTGEVALTIGPDDVEFFGVTADGQPVVLQEIYRTTRQQLSRGTPLL